MKASGFNTSVGVPVLLAIAAVTLAGCEGIARSHEGEPEHGQSAAEHPAHKVVVTSPVKKLVVSHQPYVCQIHSCKHIEVRALEGGYLQSVRVSEGQSVRRGDLLFQIVPTLYQARLQAEAAEAQRIQIELNNAQMLNDKQIVSSQEIALKTAELAKAKAKVALAEAELGFASVVAPFDGIVDRQQHQIGSLIEEGDVLTTLSDNSQMWVYFNVPEARYLEYKAEFDRDGGKTDNLKVNLKLANGQMFQQPGKIGAIEADFNNTTGNIAFRADFPNPDGLLRNGQTGTILIERSFVDSLVIPQRATFEILDKRYVYVVDSDNVVHQRDVTVQLEQDDIFVVADGLKEGEKIVFEGIRQVRDGEKIEFEYATPDQLLTNLKFHAE